MLPAQCVAASVRLVNLSKIGKASGVVLNTTKRGNLKTLSGVFRTSRPLLGSRNNETLTCLFVVLMIVLPCQVMLFQVV